MEYRLIHIGFGNVVMAERVIAIIHADSAPAKKLKEEAKMKGRLVDATQGRRTRALIVTDSGYVVLSAILPETIARRFEGETDGTKERAPFHHFRPSGAGKSTLRKKLLERFPDLVYSVSYTTRLPRPGEREGWDYRFVDEDKFRKLLREGKFLEWAQVHGNLYGTNREDVEKALEEGCDVILEIDVQGLLRSKSRCQSQC